MADRPKPKMSVAQHAFLAGVRYGYQRALKKQRRDVGCLVDEMHDEISAAKTLRQACDVEEYDPETLN